MTLPPRDAVADPGVPGKQAIAGTLSSGLRSIYAYTPTLKLTEAKPKPAFSPEALPGWLMETFA